MTLFNNMGTVAVVAALVAVALAISWALLHVPSVDPAQLRGRRVVICGASQGIGRELALQYGAAGAHVVLVARGAEALQQLAKDIQVVTANTTTVLPLAADLSQRSECERVIRTAAQALGGGIDILILNHLRPYMGAFADMADDEVQAIIDTNLASYIFLTKHGLPWLQQSPHGGALVAVSSVAGKIPVPYTALYSGLKHALHGFFDSIRSEMVHLGTTRNVSITTCVIGLVNTESQRRISKGILDSRPGTSPADVAAAIIRNAAARVHTMYYPALEGMPVSLLYRLAPRLWDMLIRLNLGHKQRP